jgi:hypothetical protein
MMAICGQRFGYRRQRRLVIVSQQHRFAGTEAPGNRLAHTAYTENGQYFAGHRHSELETAF